MNLATQPPVLPDLTQEFLKDHHIQIDNLFSCMWNRLGFPRLLNRLGFKKRSGTSAVDVVYLLLLWVWLKVDSIAMFSRESLLSFSSAHKDALYDMLNREDLNWRKLQLHIAQKLIATTEKNSTIRALVVDDSVKMRRGKKMPGVSCHFDHLTGRTVMGQQVLTLGLATQDRFVPLDSEIFISASQATPLPAAFHDQRSVVARRYQQAQNQSKPQMLEGMLSRALNAGIEAEYFLADAWFATKQVLTLTQDHSLTAIVRTKKNKTKYRLTLADESTQMLNIVELYQNHVKKQWRQVKGRHSYQAQSLVVELNLAATDHDVDRWVKVKLLFVRGVADEKSQPGKHDWAVFLTTGCHLEDSAILEIYALRWGIEVYFKEAKQHLGWLKEQSIHYSAYLASIHLTALRFCILLFAQYEQGMTSFGACRTRMKETMNTMDFASRLWILFRALILGAMNELQEEYGEAMTRILELIDQKVKDYFVQVMQMDSFTLRLEATSEAT